MRADHIGSDLLGVALKELVAIINLLIASSNMEE